MRRLCSVKVGFTKNRRAAASVLYFISKYFTKIAASCHKGYGGVNGPVSVSIRWLSYPRVSCAQAVDEYLVSLVG